MMTSRERRMDEVGGGSPRAARWGGAGSHELEREGELGTRLACATRAEMSSCGSRVKRKLPSRERTRTSCGSAMGQRGCMSWCESRIELTMVGQRCWCGEREGEGGAERGGARPAQRPEAWARLAPPPLEPPLARSRARFISRRLTEQRSTAPSTSHSQHPASPPWSQASSTSRSASTGQPCSPLSSPPPPPPPPPPRHLDPTATDAPPLHTQRARAAHPPQEARPPREARRLCQARARLPLQGGPHPEAPREGRHAQQGRVLLWHDQLQDKGPSSSRPASSVSPTLRR